MTAMLGRAKVATFEKKQKGGNMESGFSIRLTWSMAVILVAAAFLTPPAQAQQFSDWDPSTLTNLNAIVLSDGKHCPAVVNSASDDSHPAISKDGLSLFFTSTRPGPDSNGQVGLGQSDLWVTQRDSLDDCWQEPKSLGSVVNSAFRDFAPNLSSDGHWLFFTSNRTQPDADGKLPCGGADLYATHRQNKRDDFGWEPPINLGCTLNSSVDDAGPLFFEDENTGILYLYFTRNTKANDPTSDLFDIYVSTCTADLAACKTQGLWGPGEPVAELNSSVRDTRTAIRKDGLEMFISSGRPGGVGSEDIWVSTRATTADVWSTPVNLGPAVNSIAFDGAPALSWDGTALYFFSQRTDLPGFAGGRDLYVIKRAKLTGSN